MATPGVGWDTLRGVATNGSKKSERGIYLFFFVAPPLPGKGTLAPPCHCPVGTLVAVTD